MALHLRFDFVIFSENKEIVRIVEYDGEQHFLDKTNNFWKNDSLKQRQDRDNQKITTVTNTIILLFVFPIGKKIIYLLN